MSDLLRILFIVSKLYSVLTYGNKPLDNDFYKKCAHSIYRECNHRHDFSEQEIENTRIYIQNRFYNIPNRAWRPVNRRCDKLRVRKDFKCLTHNEVLELLDAVRVLYKNGAMTRLALWPHSVYWGAMHKFADVFNYHRWLVNQLELELIKVNPKLTLPYWNPFEDFDRPEYSIVWHYLGGAGDESSDYCVRDGPLAEVEPCVKRHWINDSRIHAWNSNEYYDAQLQNIRTMTDWFTWLFNSHFKPHLSIGGLEGHMSTINAPYDFSFYLYHVWLTDIQFLKWQLQADQNLVPESYEANVVYDLEVDRVRPANMSRDVLILFNATILETFQYTFGELCSIPDVIVEDVNSVINGRTVDMPAQYKRMPIEMLRKYYPKFYSGNYTPFDFQSFSLNDCNRRCAPIRQAQDFADTQEGRTLLGRLKYLAGINIKDTVVSIEGFHRQFTTDLNSNGYCSPYVMS